jgi:DNA primase
MPRIEESTIDRIKSETDLIALIQSRGTTLKKQGSNWTGLCPFHDDKETPNLIVTPGKGLFRCMASQCGKTGNAIQFVQWFDGVSFRHACEVLSTGIQITRQFSEIAVAGMKSVSLGRRQAPWSQTSRLRSLVRVRAYRSLGCRSFLSGSTLTTSSF